MQELETRDSNSAHPRRVAKPTKTGVPEADVEGRTISSLGEQAEGGRPHVADGGQVGAGGGAGADADIHLHAGQEVSPGGR